MRTLNRMLIFFTYDWNTMRLFLEAFFHLGWARLQMKKPFSKLAASFGVHMKETSHIAFPEHLPRLRNVHQAIHIMGRHTFWESQCLTKAIAAMKMLEKLGVESTLYLGTARSESGEMIAHAWLRSGRHYITGAEMMGEFTVVGTFAKEISSETKREN